MRCWFVSMLSHLVGTDGRECTGHSNEHNLLVGGEGARAHLLGVAIVVEVAERCLR